MPEYRESTSTLVLASRYWRCFKANGGDTQTNFWYGSDEAHLPVALDDRHVNSLVL